MILAERRGGEMLEPVELWLLVRVALLLMVRAIEKRWEIPAW